MPLCSDEIYWGKSWQPTPPKGHSLLYDICDIQISRFFLKSCFGICEYIHVQVSIDEYVL